MALFSTLAKRNVVPYHTQLRFLEQLAYLLTNGYSLLRSLEILEWEKTFKPIALSVQKSLQEGNYIDQALSDLGFHQSITSYLYFVRLHGDLSAHITSCAKMFARKQKYDRVFKRTIRYPLFLSFFFFLLFMAIKQFILPSFETMISSQGASSNIAHSIIQYVNTGFIIAAIGLISICALVVIWKWKKKSLVITQIINIYQKIPFYRSYVTLNTSHQLATHMATLFQSGLTIQEVLIYLQKQQKLPILSHYAYELQTQLQSGFPLAHTFEDLYFIDAHLGHLFQTNKDQQALEKDLTVYASLITKELHRKSMQMISFIQPVFFVVIAVFIISMYIAIMWPMFDVIQHM